MHSYPRVNLIIHGHALLNFCSKINTPLFHVYLYTILRYLNLNGVLILFYFHDKKRKTRYLYRGLPFKLKAYDFDRSASKGIYVKIPFCE